MNECFGVVTGTLNELSSGCFYMIGVEKLDLRSVNTQHLLILIFQKLMVKILIKPDNIVQIIIFFWCPLIRGLTVVGIDLTTCKHSNRIKSFNLCVTTIVILALPSTRRPMTQGHEDFW